MQGQKLNAEHLKRQKQDSKQKRLLLKEQRQLPKLMPPKKKLPKQELKPKQE